MVRAQWYNHNAFTAKILFSTFPDLAGSFIVASKFASFHLRFGCCCGRSIKSVWGGWGLLLRSLCLTLQFVCVSLCKSAYTQLVDANALRLTASKPHGSTVYFWCIYVYMAFGFPAKQIWHEYYGTLFLRFILIFMCNPVGSTSSIMNPPFDQFPLNILIHCRDRFTKISKEKFVLK